ncbi:SWIM zinc finger family protein [Streptomyces sp. SLBN-31]|uniref:SWIM zinc finger family protein n=1 Tax=Streptomyces sp. SLBN-31 TaxID=2768444 RepID=UPI00114D5098|nr:SWIM zinc finger family protein [Streptomyces sp. SLBN-31]TQJ90879.1 putative Zn finger protein [Streptomyces sp. SLBN-31]
MTPSPADEARRALREARERRLRDGEEGAGGETRTPAPDRPASPDGPTAVAGAEEGAAPGGAVEEVSMAGAPATGEEPSGQPRHGQARPGDAARAALRRALAADARPGAEPSAAEQGDPAGEGGAERFLGEEETESSGGRQAGGADAAQPSLAASGGRRADAGADGVRPADAAREALRAARSRARRDEEAGERAGGLPAWGPRRAERTAEATRGGAVGRSSTGEATRGGAVGRPSTGEATRGGAVGRFPGGQAHAVRDLLAGAFRMPSDEAPPEDETTRGERTGTGGSADADVPPTAPDVVPTSPPPAPSMAAPSRDGELRRTFPALPPPASGAFARTWWGNAWVTALEEGALDAKRLARGRSYAEQGHVDAITVTPGLVLAYVQGSRPRPYRVQVRLRTLEDADWQRFLEAAVERTGHIAALLDKELPHSLADCGVPLLPGPHDLDPHCSCPDRGHPCKHAAALCYQTARLLDADPFVLLLLRGRGERELLDALSRLNAARAARAAQEREPARLPGVRAAEAVLATGQLPPLPPPLPVPPHPGQPPVYPAAPGGPDPFALDQLATDAAARAHALLSTGRDPVAELTLWQDAVRVAAARPGSGLTAATRSLYASLASASGRTPAELARAVAAWRQGGLEGLAVLEEPWDPPAGRFDRARPLLLAADLPAFRPWHNHLTHPRGHVQLRLGRDGLWYAYESEPGHDDWWPRGTPDLDPVGALTGLGAPNDL